MSNTILDFIEELKSQSSLNECAFVFRLGAGAHLVSLERCDCCGSPAHLSDGFKVTNDDLGALYDFLRSRCVELEKENLYGHSDEWGTECDRCGGVRQSDSLTVKA